MRWTVMRLARACGVSRGTVLHYESVGLLKPARRTAGNYRVYGEADLERLHRIRVYREAGLTLPDIRAVLDQRGDAASVLHRRFAELGRQIEQLRDHQKAIARLLKIRRFPMVTKQKWVDIMRAAGFGDEEMRRWHAEFERSAPQEHQEFLEFLHIPGPEIATIRGWSRQG